MKKKSVLYYEGTKCQIKEKRVFRGGHELSDEIVTAVLDSIVVIK